MTRFDQPEKNLPWEEKGSDEKDQHGKIIPEPSSYQSTPFNYKIQKFHLYKHPRKYYPPGN